jgi:uncharacterized protein with PIN domain
VILDSSAIVSVILAEPGFEAARQAIADRDLIGVGAPTLGETGAVLSAPTGPAGTAALELRRRGDGQGNSVR